MFKLGFAALLPMSLAFALAAPACDSIDRIYDCASICNAYKDCINSNYDATACTQKCEDQASDSEAFEDRADDCQECIDDRSCAGSVFSCTDNCVGIVP
jgi:hypothetical protein